MNGVRQQIFLVAFGLVAMIVGRASADPLSYETLKFQQLPLNFGYVPTYPDPIPNGGAPYTGHDEWSTANLHYDPTVGETFYSGTFMADDFADKLDTPVVHLRWWGSYDHNLYYDHVQKFLIAFESDVPAGTDAIFSHPGTPLLTQEVERLVDQPLTPHSGTFTENIINNINGGESLWEYNAELKVPFHQEPNKVYWLKIAALVDPNVEGPINWGWHDRDWSLTNNLFGMPPGGPGERPQVADPPGEPVVWHFQDDAVSGNMVYRPPVGLTIAGVIGAPPPLQQFDYAPQFYRFPEDGPEIIQVFSKDLAFELYTVPEPSSLILLCLCGVGLAAARRRRIGCAN